MYYVDGLDFVDQFMPNWMPPSPPLSDSEDVYWDDGLDLLYEKDYLCESRLPSIIHELHRPLMKPPSPVKAAIPPSAEHTAVMNLLNSYSAAPQNQMSHHYAQQQPLIPLVPMINDERPVSYTPNHMDMHTGMEFNDIKTEPFADIRVPQKKERKQGSARQDHAKGRDLTRPVTPPAAIREELDYEGPEWTIVEDHALLTAVQNEERMTHSMERNRSTLQYNWEYVAGFVNKTAGHYRSPRQCSIRYQAAVRPRELGQLVTIDPVLKKPRKVHLTPAEVVHLRKGRTTTDLQYQYDATRMLEAKSLGRMKLIRAIGQKRWRPYRKNIDPQSLHCALGLLPRSHESRLLEHGVQYGIQKSVEEIVAANEESWNKLEQSRKKPVDKQIDDRGASPAFVHCSVSIRGPAVPAGPDIVQAKVVQYIEIPYCRTQQPLPVATRPLAPPQLQQQQQQQQSQPMLAPQERQLGVQVQPQPQPVQMSAPSQPTMARRMGPGVGGNLQHIAPSSGNYVVVNSDGTTVSPRMQSYGQRPEPVPGQPVYRTLQTNQVPKRTPPVTPISRVPMGYMTAGGQTNSGQVYTTGGTGAPSLQQQGNRTGRVVQQRLQQMPQRMYVQQSATGERTTYVVPPQHPGGQLRMVSAQPRGQQKRTIGSKPTGHGQMPMMVAARTAGQNVQPVRAIQRYQPSGRVVNVNLIPGQHLRAANQPGGQGMQPGTHVVPGMTRQLLNTANSMSRQMSSQSRGGSPQTIAQVVLAPSTQPPPTHQLETQGHMGHAAHLQPIHTQHHHQQPGSQQHSPALLASAPPALVPQEPIPQQQDNNQPDS